MLPRSPVFVVGTLLVLLANACGDTARNSDGSDASDTGSTATGSGGSTTEGATSTATTSVTNGTGGTPNVCPSFEPAEGSSCPSAGQMCVFENCQAPLYRDQHTLTCVDGGWKLTLANTCAIDCPEVPPKLGDWCDDSLPSAVPCVGVDACGGTRQVVCVNAVWQNTDDELPERPGTGAGGTGAGEAPLCPGTPPYLGEPCCPWSMPERCDYPETGTAGAAGASFIVLPTTGGGFDAPVILDCAVCTDEMVWGSCPAE